MPNPTEANPTAQATLPMDSLSAKTRKIGEIGNCYGDLKVAQQDSRFFWAIENWNGHEWEEIPEYLFVALNRFQDEKKHLARVPAHA